jgi:hypothetical protein
MFNFDKKIQVYLLIGVSLFIAMIACKIEAPKIIWEETLTVTPDVQIRTQVVTQIVTPTPLPTSTPKPTPTPQPTPSPTWDPMTVPIYYPLEDCVASRLHVGDKAMVSLVGGSNGIRYGSDLRQDTIMAYADPGDVLEITGGPWCSYGWLVWKVRTGDGIDGFTPEGNGIEYWLVPLPR